MGGRFDGVGRIDLDFFDFLVLFNIFSDSRTWGLSAVLMLRYIDTRTRFCTVLYPPMTRNLWMTGWDIGPSATTLPLSIAKLQRSVKNLSSHFKSLKQSII